MIAPRRALLEVRDAHKSYAGRPALRGVDLHAAAGEWIGLLGPNGAGKTTLMRAISGRIELDRGAVRVGDDGRVGFVPQEIALYPALTGRENLEVFGRLHGVTAKRLAERVREALEWSGLAARAEDKVDTYSGGMQRRLNIACGVLHRPRVILLDEPTVGVDPQGRIRIWEMLDGLRRDGAVLLQSSHQLDEIETMCDRMTILDRGRIVAEGTLDELAASTAIGSRAVRLELDGPPTPTALPPDCTVDGRRVATLVRDVGAELPDLLHRIRAAGLRILDVHVERPTLDQIFVRLTGRGARE
jgi:ABC-2 type transport system ATP-binding protein